MHWFQSTMLLRNISCFTNMEHFYDFVIFCHCESLCHIFCSVENFRSQLTIRLEYLLWASKKLIVYLLGKK